MTADKWQRRLDWLEFTFVGRLTVFSTVCVLAAFIIVVGWLLGWLA